MFGRGASDSIATNEDVSLIQNNKLFNQIKPNLIFLDPPFKIKNIDNIINDLKNIINKKNVLVIHTNSENNIENEELDVIEERIYGVSKIYFAKLNLT
jgi:16S rRNA (guanine966-N2)-methyltransferase